jgi:hypothetical protein
MSKRCLQKYFTFWFRAHSLINQKELQRFEIVRVHIFFHSHTSIPTPPTLALSREPLLLLFCIDCIWHMSSCFCFFYIGDLWGPLIICLLLAMWVLFFSCILSPGFEAVKYSILNKQQGWCEVCIWFLFSFRFLYSGAPGDQRTILFAAAFVIVWVGALVVTLNAVLLKGHVYSHSYHPIHFIWSIHKRFELFFFVLFVYLFLFDQ